MSAGNPTSYISAVHVHKIVPKIVDISLVYAFPFKGFFSGVVSLFRTSSRHRHPGLPILLLNLSSPLLRHLSLID